MNYYAGSFRKVSAGLLITSISFGFLIMTTIPAHAAVADWQRGADVVPISTTDLASSNFQQSLANLKNDGATYVSLVVPYYQSNISSTDIAPGWNTPDDASLASAIDYAHSIGLAVTLKMHVDPYSGDWRAYIDPTDRTVWFTNYGKYLLHLADIGKQHGAEMIVIGSELVDMATYAHNSDNTSRWQNLIAQVRGVYSGKLTYDANSDNNISDIYQNEKKFIGFWSNLDYAGLSVYYNLNSDNSVTNLEGQWDYWNNNDLKGFAAGVGKPLLFMEVGYRSVDGAHYQPWNWSMSGTANETEQANDYQALFSYWNNYSYIGGVYLWYWETNPNAGGGDTTSYTPQNKPAEQVMKQWFSGSGQPTPPSNSFSFSASGSTSPSNPNAGSSASLNTTVQNMGSALMSGIVDMEVYDQNNSRVFQQFWSGQNIAAGASQTYSTNWTPSTNGTYAMAIGVFSGDWSQNYYWNGNAVSIPVGSSGTSTPPTGTSTPPTTATGPLDVWWPTDNSHVSGVQPFKAMVENIDPATYRMFWAVGSGQWNQMSDNAADYPHKEALVDLSGWTWNGAGPYPVTFIATQTDGSTIITQKSINLWTQ